DLPHSGRAVSEGPVQELRKSTVSSILSCASSSHAQTKSAVATPGDHRPKAVEPSERSRPRGRSFGERRPRLFKIKHDQYLWHGFYPRSYLFRQAQEKRPIVMAALIVEPNLVKQLARQQIAGRLDKARSTEQ